MGIRFLCPNGHRLNVKQDLAGKRGVCPECAARFEIPLMSTIPSRRQEAAAAAAAGVEAPVADESVAIEPAASADPTAEPTAAPSVEPPAVEIFWYVELPSGERLGPAEPETMRGWLEEGRVVADSLVWRTGWEEWQASDAAERAFSLTVAATEAPAVESPEAAPEPSDVSAVIPVEEPSATAPSATLRNRRQQQKQRRKQATVLLTAVVLVLGLVLVVVLSL